MIDPSTLLPIPRSFLADAPTATVNVGLALMSRRSNAIADFWRSCAEIREPTDLMAVQLNYWSHLVDDYQEAISAGLSQIAPPAAGAPEASPVASAPEPAPAAGAPEPPPASDAPSA